MSKDAHALYLKQLNEAAEAYAISVRGELAIGKNLDEESFKAGALWAEKHSLKVLALVEAIEKAHAHISGCAMTGFPMNVRELDGSISTVRPKSSAGYAYDVLGAALTNFRGDNE